MRIEPGTILLGGRAKVAAVERGTEGDDYVLDLEERGERVTVFIADALLLTLRTPESLRSVLANQAEDILTGRL